MLMHQDTTSDLRHCARLLACLQVVLAACSKAAAVLLSHRVASHHIALEGQEPEREGVVEAVAAEDLRDHVVAAVAPKLLKRDSVAVKHRNTS